MQVEDYPRTLAELERRFSSEKACREYLSSLRWPDGFRCPRCGPGRAWLLASGRWQCAGCNRQVSVTAGTVFQDTRTPLTVWFRAMWWMTSQKNGVSALGLQQVLGWGSYQTAWTCLHKLRRAMIRPGRDRLSGTVEVDESYLGGLEAGTHGRGAALKVLIAVAGEEDGRGTGRIRLRYIPDASAASLTPFIQDSIEPGSLLHTDGWRGYASIATHGYEHKVTLVKQGPEKPSDLLPRVHRVISLLKRWLLGTHQGAVGIDHLQEYLDEFAFRFNRRRSRSRGKLFYRLIQQAVAIEPTTYREIVDQSQSREHLDHNP
jgi:transposase-like protein